MNKLNRIFSIVLTAAIAISLLVSAAPVSAANNYWDQLATPGATGQVMADNIVASGLLTPAMNGDLYAYVKTTSATVPYKLAKSVNGGRAWTYVTAPLAADITAIATSPSEANVVYFAQGAAVYKSIDSGATFTSVASVPAGTVSALGVSLLGGSYKIFAGTVNAGAGNVFILNEGDFPKAFGLWDITFAARDVLALKLSPTFATDNGVVVVAANAVDTRVFVSVGGNAFSGSFGSAIIAATVATTAAIAFPAEFSLTGATATPVFYVGIGDGAGAGVMGVFRFAGAAASTVTSLVAGDVVSLAATGSYAGTGTVLAGTAAAGVLFSAASGIGTWGTVSRQPTGAGATFVALKSDYATSTTSFALRAAGAVDDESGFFMSTDANKDWNGIALLNSTIVDINNNQLAFASNGDIFMITSAGTLAPAVGDAFTLTAATLAGTVGDTITLAANASANWFQPDVAIFNTVNAVPISVTITATAPGDIIVTGSAGVTITGTGPYTVTAATAGQTVTITKTAATASTTVTLVQTVGLPADLTIPPAGVDQNFQPGPYLDGTPFPMDLNPVIVTLNPSASDTAVMSPSGPFTFTAAGQTQLLTTTTAGTMTFGTGFATTNVTAAVTSNPDSVVNPIAIVNAAPIGSVSGLNLNNSSIVAVVGNVTITPGGIGVTVGGVAGNQTVTFTAVGQTATATALGAGNATWTNTTGTATATETNDPNASMTVGTSGVSFAMDMNPTIIGGAHSIWRFVGGNWERTVTGIVSTDLTKIAVSPNYATDKAVFYYNGTTGKMYYSTNNGLTFSAQTTAVPAAVNNYVVLDSLTLVVATGSGVYKTANNGVFWGVAPQTAQAVTMLTRSSDGTTLIGNVGGAIVKSTDLGNTWTTASTVAVQILAGITSLTFQNGSNTVVWATTAGGLFSIDLAAASDTVGWDAANRAAAASGTALDQPAAAFTTGLSVVSGSAPTGKYAVYALNAGSIARKLNFGTNNSAGTIALPATMTGVGLFIQPAPGANKIWMIAANGTIWTLTDQMAAAVAGVAVGSFTNTTAVVNWTALAGANKYQVNLAKSADVTAALSNPYSTTNVAATATATGTTTTFTGLASNTTYYASVWAIQTNDGTNDIPRVSFAGSISFSTQPDAVGAPPILAPAAGATGIATVPGFQWGPVTGATSYTLEVSTSSTFATLVGTKQTTTIPAFAWTTPALAYNTTYYWRVIAITATGSSAPVIGVFTTVIPPTTAPSGGGGGQGVTTTSTVVTVTNASTETPGYVWAMIGIGALLVILIVVLTIRTRRVV